MINYSNQQVEVYCISKETALRYLQEIKDRDTINIFKQAVNNLNNNKIIFCYQPIVNNKTKKIFAYEMLTRIQANNRIIPPYEFIEILYRQNYSEMFVQYSMLEALTLIRKHRVEDAKLSINISLKDLKEKSLQNFIVQTFNAFKEEAQQIVIEIVEDHFHISIQEENEVKNFLVLLKNKYNSKLALDDFGTQSSNFDRLLSFEPDIIKIDGSFAKHLHLSKTYRFVEDIVKTAKENNIATVIEHVENEKIFNMAREIGVEYSQGYFFGKPEAFTETDKRSKE